MKPYDATSIHNVGLFGHQGAGKTALAEALLYCSGAIDRLGRTDDGTATTDFDSEEQRRRISINIGLAPCEWHGAKLNIVDVPGYLDFVNEVRCAMAVVDAAILVTPAQNQPEVGFDIAWDAAVGLQRPRAVFINRMDRENADFAQVVTSLRTRYGTAIAPFQLPIGSADSFAGVIDLLEMRAFIGAGKEVTETEIPAEYRAEADRYRELLVESAAEGEDGLLEKYLGGDELTHDEVMHGLHTGIDAGKVVPVLCGSAARDIGMTDLLDIIVHEFPHPGEVGPVVGRRPGSDAAEEVRPVDASAPLALQVFKTIADPFLGTLSYFRVCSGTLKAGQTLLNTCTGREERIGQIYFARGKNQELTTEIRAGDLGVTSKLAETHTGDTLCDPTARIILPDFALLPPAYEVAVVAKSKVDEDKLGPALQRVAMADPSFQFRRDAETGQTVIAGAGDTHLSIVVERLKKFGANVDVVPRRIAYRETIGIKAEGQGKHKKQSGGRGQYGDCWVRLEPNPGGGIVFVDATVGGSVPRQYLPAVEKGIRQASQSGTVAGFPVVDFTATCYDGSYHDVDSSEAAFIMAGIQAFNNVAAKANPVLLEPIVSLEVVVPEGMLGDVMSDLSSRRGRIVGTTAIGGHRICLSATVPEAELLTYAIDLRSISKGRGSFSLSPLHYEEVPAHVAQTVVNEAKVAKEHE
ncbi:MAG: elongation factor G [Armatimonadetes bacterium]|nr:elongation factor G [Armatimonadota bacterium]MDE2206872.1 elongation factor G [Armatimonadota bacterium]